MTPSSPADSPFIIAFAPCYNESASIENTIRRMLENGVHWVIVTNDGSKDNSLEVLQKTAKETNRVFVLNFQKNQGVSAAKITGFALAWTLFRRNLIPASSLLVKLDSDGQHDPKYIPEMAGELTRRKLDFLLSYRDFSVYPRFKIIGNWLVSIAASILTGRLVRDSMSGLKIMTMPVLGEIISYFTGFRYAAAQEITMIPALRGFSFANDYLVNIPIYKSGSGMRDGMSVVRMSFIAWWRVLTKKRVNPDQFSRELLLDPNTQLTAHPSDLSLNTILNLAPAAAV